MTTLVIEAALRGLLFAAVVGAGLSLLRVRHIPTRKAAWTLVLVAAMAMPFLMRSSVLGGLQQKLGWAVPIRMSAAAPATAPAITALSAESAVRDSAVIPVETKRTDSSPAAAAETTVIPDLDAPLPIEAQTSIPAPRKNFAWPPVGRILVWTYLAVAGILLLRLLFGLGAALRLWVMAEPVSPLVSPDGNVRASRNIASPVTVGSGIVLPADYAQWERSRLRMVLAHEQSHVRQMDFWLQLLAGLYAAALWFSPLGWWLRRKLAQLGEAMSDRAGMDAANSGSDYAQVVLEFAALPRRRLPGVAMASTGNLTRRIDSLLNESRFRSAFAEGRRRALASLLLIPAALFTAMVLVRVPAAAAQAAPANSGPKGAPVTSGPKNAPAQPGPAGAPTGAGPAQPAPTGAPSGSGPVQAAPQSVPMPPPPHDPAAPIVPPNAEQTVVPPGAPPQAAPLPPPTIREGAGSGEGSGQSAAGSGTTIVTRHRNGSDSSDFDYHAMPNGDAWAVASGAWSDANLPSSLSATRRAEIERAHRTANGPFLWFTHDGKSYVVTDPAAVARIEGMYEAFDALSQENFVQLPDLSQVTAEAQEAIARAQADIRVQFSPQVMAQYEADIKAAQAEFTPEKMAELKKQLQDTMKSAQQYLSPQKQAELQGQIAQAEKNLQKAQAHWNAQTQADMQARMAEMQKHLAEEQNHIAAAEAKLNSSEMQARMAEAEKRVAEAQRRARSMDAQRIDRRVEQIIQESLANGTAHPQ